MSVRTRIERLEKQTRRGELEPFWAVVIYNPETGEPLEAIPENAPGLIYLPDKGRETGFRWEETTAGELRGSVKLCHGVSPADWDD